MSSASPGSGTDASTSSMGPGGSATGSQQTGGPPGQTTGPGTMPSSMSTTTPQMKTMPTGQTDGGGTNPSGGGDAGPTMPAAPSNYQIAKMFVGNYGGLLKFRKIETVGSFGTFNTLVSIYATVSITDDATNMAVTLTASGCHLDLSGTGTNLLNGAMLSLPDVVIQSTTLDPVTFSASGGDGGPIMWSTTELHGPIGWKWASPSDMTPTSASDSRVFDQDMDGNPGCTMDVMYLGMTTKVFFVQTQRDVISGTVGANGALTGTTVDTGDQVVIGSDNSLLQGVMNMWTTDPNMMDNTVQIVPVSAPLTCMQLMSQASTLFK